MKKLKLIILIFAATSSLAAQANCDRVIKAADAAIAALQVEVKQQDAVIVGQSALIEDLASQNSTQAKELDKWYRKPQYTLMGGIILGLLVGAAVGK